MIPLDGDEEEALGESARPEEGLRYWESNSSVTIAQLEAAVQQDRTDEASWLQLALLQPGRTAALQVLLTRVHQGGAHELDAGAGAGAGGTARWCATVGAVST